MASFSLQVLQRSALHAMRPRCKKCGHIRSSTCHCQLLAAPTDATKLQFHVNYLSAGSSLGMSGHVDVAYHHAT